MRLFVCLFYPLALFRSTGLEIREGCHKCFQDEGMIFYNVRTASIRNKLRLSTILRHVAKAS